MINGVRVVKDLTDAEKTWLRESIDIELSAYSNREDGPVLAWCLENAERIEVDGGGLSEDEGRFEWITFFFGKDDLKGFSWNQCGWDYETPILVILEALRNTEMRLR